MKFSEQEEEYIQSIVNLASPSVHVKAKRYDKMVERLNKVINNPNGDKAIKELSKFLLEQLEGGDNDN